MDRVQDDTQYDWFGMDGGSLGIYWPTSGGLASIGTAGNPPAGAVSTLGTRVQLKRVIALGGGTVNFKIYAGNGSTNYFLDASHQFAVGAGVTQDFDIILPQGMAIELLGAAGAAALVSYRVL